MLWPHRALGPLGLETGSETRSHIVKFHKVKTTQAKPHKQNHTSKTSHHPSFFASNTLTICGLAWPLDAFMTCPTEKPSMVFFPPRYCSSCLGLATRTSSMIFSSADVSVDCRGLPSSS